LISGQALVHAQRLAVTYYGGVRALAEVDFDLPPGQFVSIVGPSGCGKSTILRLIAGLVEPSGGQLTIAGQKPAIARRRESRLAFVFQDPTLLPWRRALANVALPLELAGRGRSQREDAARRALEMVGLADFTSRFPSQLSGGMRMRVSLARALVVEPDLLLLDEPFAALDDITRQKLNEELIRLWENHHWTGVFVTHNIAEAVFLSQRILVMSPRPGRIVADVTVPFEFPRRMELRSRPEFGRLCGEVMARLEEANT
jgi:NitT/TauT family transport system ATP-binding protein